MFDLTDGIKMQRQFSLSLAQPALLSGNLFLQINMKKSNSAVEKWSRDINKKNPRRGNLNVQ